MGAGLGHHPGLTPHTMSQYYSHPAFLPHARDLREAQAGMQVRPIKCFLLAAVSAARHGAPPSY